MPSQDEIHAQLCRRELDQTTLKNLAEAVANLDAKGFLSTDVFPLGIIIQDGAAARFEVEPGRLGGLVDELSRLRDLRPEIRIFPLGIVAPDRFSVEAKIGRASR